MALQTRRSSNQTEDERALQRAVRRGQSWSGVSWRERHDLDARYLRFSYDARREITTVTETVIATAVIATTPRTTTTAAGAARR